MSPTNDPFPKDEIQKATRTFVNAIIDAITQLVPNPVQTLNQALPDHTREDISKNCFDILNNTNQDHIFQDLFGDLMSTYPIPKKIQLNLTDDCVQIASDMRHTTVEVKYWEKISFGCLDMVENFQKYLWKR